jgi:hypothetical protein
MSPEVEAIAQVGVGGALALLIVREVLAFLKGRNGKTPTSAGDKSVEFWQMEYRKATDEALRPLLAAQTAVLSDIAQTQHEMNERLGRLVYIAEKRP